jgi:hypothetical protein
MPTPEIEEFAKLLVREVRDHSIVSCDSQLKQSDRKEVERAPEGHGVASAGSVDDS